MLTNLPSALACTGRTLQVVVRYRLKVTVCGRRQAKQRAHVFGPGGDETQDRGPNYSELQKLHLA